MVARFSGFTFDGDRRLILDALDRPVHVTAKAFDLLALLIAASPGVVSKREPHERLRPGSFVTDAAVVGLIKELRRVLDDRESNRLIRTSHGVGYTFTAATKESPESLSAHWIAARGRRIQLSPGENVMAATRGVPCG